MRPVIICVDDDESVLSTLKKQLKFHFKGKYGVEVAESGEEALELVDELMEESVEIPLFISDQIMPGITAASAAVAAIGQSLTQRGRNSSVRFLTGHDMRGFADQDWAALARPGEVAAIYMGKKSARFVQGRLIMHGANRATPVTVVENASRADQRVLETTLDHLPMDLAEAAFDGPALTFFGLAPRQSAAALYDLNMELA